jgi:hypothetical protein
MKNLFTWIIFLLLTGVVVTCTPDDDSIVPQKPAATIEGLYKDTASVYSPSLTIIDSIITKEIYKVNDSTYWMPGYFFTDSNFVGPIWYLPYGNRLFFRLRPDGSLIAFPDAPYDPLTYDCSFLSYFDKTGYIYLGRCRTANPRWELHRLRKF